MGALEIGTLIMMLVAGTSLVYMMIGIHDIPYQIAKRRGHPHADAIHAAGWVSLFTLHAIWPFLWIWAFLWHPERGYGTGGAEPPNEELVALRKRLEDLEKRASTETHAAERKAGAGVTTRTEGEG